MAKEIDCPCERKVTGEDSDQLVANAEEHMPEKHPEIAGPKSSEEVLAMPHDA